ncbi:hypothetical protein ZIOFF_014535 [Zingiber officinale]|uniref:Photosystem I reaction center subunit XI, chloroplastic n=2 Tax=Zingiber officinale TaxID=94328 RepID=A0A8J5HBR7_ZINOF|nr:hypothetical protein ZIOFF_014535 [Zingiber officinale]
MFHLQVDNIVNSALEVRLSFKLKSNLGPSSGFGGQPEVFHFMNKEKDKDKIHQPALSPPFVSAPVLGEETKTMAVASAPSMACQLKTSLLCSSSSRIRGLSSPALARKRLCLTVRAIQAEKPTTYQVIQPINGDPFIGSLETPITSSPLVAWYLSNLPAYRTAVSPLLRGIEVGLAHGYLLVGPFVKTGPLRNTEVAGAAGSLAAAGLVVILTVCLSMYGVASFNEGDPSTAPTLTLTGRKKEADKLQTAEGWAQFSGGFFFGGISGVIWAYFLLYVLDLPYYIK